MTRPQTAQDVFDVLSRNRLVEPVRLGAFIDRHSAADAESTLEALVTDGLLTRFQAGEVAGGRGAALWLGGYRVLDRLGRGGMGNVFLAEHPVLGRRVAVKALSDALRADPGARRRFVREARAAAALDHPNIVHVFDVNMTHEPPYLVMEYVDGISLQAAVSHTGTFSVGEAASVGVQVADGLVQAAAVGLVHRDIKPANLLVDRRGSVKILDLGIVRFTHDDTFSRIHAAEVILGTVDYLAPEQAEDSSKVDSRADIYALGATLYFLLAGHPPYTNPDVRLKLAAKQSVDPPPIHQLRPDVPTEFSDILARLMARDPAERYLSAAMAAAALHPWAAPGGDFPARVFRLSSESTAHGRHLTEHEPSREPLPETIRIIKPSSRRASSASADVDVAQAPPAAPSVASPEPPDAGGGSEEPLPLAADESVAAGQDVSAPTNDTKEVANGAVRTDEMLALPDTPTAPKPALLAALAPKTPAPPGDAPTDAPGQPLTLGIILAVVAVAVAAGLLIFLTR